MTAVARLGYLHAGRGTWWNVFHPAHLTACDLDPEKSPFGRSVDFTALPFLDGSFRAVAFDPPYKLNGTPSADVDERYGVHVVTEKVDALHMLAYRPQPEGRRQDHARRNHSTLLVFRGTR